MKNTTTIDNFVLKLQTPDNNWSELETFAFIEDAEAFGNAVTIGATKIFKRTTTTIIEEEEIE